MNKASKRNCLFIFKLCEWLLTCPVCLRMANLSYIRNFCFSQSSKDELSYCLSTFEAAVEYISLGKLQDLQSVRRAQSHKYIHARMVMMLYLSTRTLKVATFFLLVRFQVILARRDCSRRGCWVCWVRTLPRPSTVCLRWAAATSHHLSVTSVRLPEPQAISTLSSWS